MVLKPSVTRVFLSIIFLVPSASFSPGYTRTFTMKPNPCTTIPRYLVMRLVVRSSSKEVVEEQERGGEGMVRKTTDERSLEADFEIIDDRLLDGSQAITEANHFVPQLSESEAAQLKQDEWHMQCALHLASSAAAEGEVPVGAVLVASNGTVLSRAHNMVARSNDPTAHAELLAVRKAAALTGNWRLGGCTLYCTLEYVFTSHFRFYK